MAASSPSVARAWPSNWFVAIDWLLHVFRSLLPATFLKAFSTCGAAVLTNRGDNLLDENGNPLPVDETGAKAEDASSDIVQSRNVSRMLEDQQPQSSVHSAEGRARKGGKEVARKGTKAQAKAQTKQKSFKSKKNEIGAKTTKVLEQGSGSEAVHHGTSAEAKNQKQDYRNQMKNMEEECHDEGNDEQPVISLSETGSVEEDCRDEFNEAENNTSVNTDAIPICSSGQRDLDVTNVTTPPELCVNIPEEKLSPIQGQTRKKRRKGKQNRSQSSKTVSTSVGVKISSNSGAIGTNDPIIDSSSSMFPVNISPASPVISVPFCCHQLSNARQKPSARVPPSRSTAMDHELNLRTVSDVGEKTPDGLSIVENKRIEEAKFCSLEEQEIEKVSLSVETRSDSTNAFRVDRKSIADLESSQPFKNDLAQGLSTDVVEEILPKVQPCVTVQASLTSCPLSPSRKQSTVVGQQGRVRPQSTVNPFSVLDTITSVKSVQTIQQDRPALHPIPQTRIRVEPITGSKPKFNQPPRLKPRSLINPVNPLHVEQSLQSRFRLHPKFDSVSAPTDLSKSTAANDLTEMRTSAVSDPNPTFRILRRRPGPSSSQAKHSDSNSIEAKNSVDMTEHCSNNCYGNGCYSCRGPSVSRTTVSSELSNSDNVASTTKRTDVAKKSPSSSLLDRKIVDPIPGSIQLSAPRSSTDAEPRTGERESGSGVGSSTRDRFPNGSRTFPKNMNTAEHRTNLCSSQVDENALTFDLLRAQQYLRTEFLKTIELKKRGGNVKILKL